VRLGNTGGGERHVHPAGESVLDVPLALAVADQNNGVDLMRATSISFGRAKVSQRPLKCGGKAAARPHPLDTATDTEL